MKRRFWVLAAICAVITTSVGAGVQADESATVTVRGIGENVTVTMTMEDGVIKAVEASSDNTEADERGRESLQLIADEMVKKNSVNVDAVSGATGTSNAVIAASIEAWLQLKEAEFSEADWMKKAVDENPGPSGSK